MAENVETPLRLFLVKKKKKKKVKAWKQPRHSHSCLIIPAIREQSIFRFSTTVRHPFVAWKFNWKTEGSRFRENFLPLSLSFFRDLFPNDKKIAKTWTRFNRVLFLYFFSLKFSQWRLSFIGFRIRLEIPIGR